MTTRQLIKKITTDFDVVVLSHFQQWDEGQTSAWTISLHKGIGQDELGQNERINSDSLYDLTKPELLKLLEIGSCRCSVSTIGKDAFKDFTVAFY